MVISFIPAFFNVSFHYIRTRHYGLLPDFFFSLLKEICCLNNHLNVCFGGDDCWGNLLNFHLLVPISHLLMPIFQNSILLIT